MLHIAKTEWLKIKKYPAFWWVLGITALTYPGVNYIILGGYKESTSQQSASGQVVRMLLGNPFSFPEAWKTVAFLSSLFIFIPAIVVIMLITNEYTYKTNRQNIIDGWSRREFMIGKLISVLILTAIVTVLYTIVAYIIGATNTTDAAASQSRLAFYIGLFALQTFSQLSLAFVVGLMVRKSFIALAIFIFYAMILDPAAYAILKYKYEISAVEFLPMQISNFLIPKPAFLGRIDPKAYQASLDAINPHIWYTIILILITWAFCFWTNSRRDL